MNRDNFINRLDETLETLKKNGRFRTLPRADATLGTVNLSSNDYLGLAQDLELRNDFFSKVSSDDLQLTSASSRLLTGSSHAVEHLEKQLAEMYNAEAALAFNCGYHANSGILPAIATSKSLILADKLIHASLIDGIKLSGCDFYRFKHNDLNHLEHLLTQHSEKYETVFVVTESVFSMDGDFADLHGLVKLKRKFPNVLLYLDEAHGVGVFGENGLGRAVADGVSADIDFLVGTCGKALASNGAYVIAKKTIVDFLVNTMRPFIFTTALAPINYAWTSFIFENMKNFKERQIKVLNHSKMLNSVFANSNRQTVSQSQILPLLIGSAENAIAAAKELRNVGFYVLPIRPPTVPEGSSRLRFSLTAAISDKEIIRLIDKLHELKIL